MLRTNESVQMTNGFTNSNVDESTLQIDSFAPERNYNKVVVLVGGSEFFNDLHEKLLTAQRSIYIAMFWLSPELYLLRPVLKGRSDLRIMDILKLKAEQGVVIKILIYKEIKGALPNNSRHTYKLLTSLHPNIRVKRHPKNRVILKKWAHHEKIVIIDETRAYVGGIDACWGRYDTPNYPIYEKQTASNLEFFPGIDYSNVKVRDFTNVGDYHNTNIDRKLKPRLPWHDISLYIYGPSVIDVTRHFMQRWHFAFTHINTKEDDLAKQVLMVTEDKGKIEFENRISEEHNLSVQIVRSLSHWSGGVEQPENSILNAYYTLIDNAKHYIIIQNQFFISCAYDNEEFFLYNRFNHKKLIRKVYNEVAFHIRKRIERAYLEKKKFRVIIVIPLVPGFPGDMYKSQNKQTIMKYTYRSICRNRGLSIIESLRTLMGDKLQDYISFLSIRNHALIGDVPKTEIIYVHSKSMLIDDEISLVGSANINDRSLLGTRDSEVCAIIKDSNGFNQVNGVMDGKSTAISKFTRDFRLRLFKVMNYFIKQHLGFSITDPNIPSILLDPLSDEFWQFLNNTARNNTLLYRKIFLCSPDDTFRSFKEVKKNLYDLEVKKELYKIHKDEFRGHVVEFPLNYLSDENLNRKLLTLERFVPLDIFI